MGASISSTRTRCPTWQCAMHQLHMLFNRTFSSSGGVKVGGISNDLQLTHTRSSVRLLLGGKSSDSSATSSPFLCGTDSFAFSSATTLLPSRFVLIAISAIHPATSSSPSSLASSPFFSRRASILRCAFGPFGHPLLFPRI